MLERERTPFVQPPKSRRKAADLEAPTDPDIETVGRVLEGSRLYVIGALFFLSSSVSFVLLQVRCVMILLCFGSSI